MFDSNENLSSFLKGAAFAVFILIGGFVFIASLTTAAYVYKPQSFPAHESAGEASLKNRDDIPEASSKETDDDINFMTTPKVSVDNFIPKRQPEKTIAPKSFQTPEPEIKTRPEIGTRPALKSSFAAQTESPKTREIKMILPPVVINIPRPTETKTPPTKTEISDKPQNSIIEQSAPRENIIMTRRQETTNRQFFRDRQMMNRQMIKRERRMNRFMRMGRRGN
ncbi:MAG: hypothetical protein ACR2HG_07695 [Pyrinomonadaceae bacterium]